MRVCIDLPGGIADILAAVRSLAQGIGKFAIGIGTLPSAISSRISRSHAKSDSSEDQAQASVSQTSSPIVELTAIKEFGGAGVSRLLNKLIELRQRGLVVDVVQQPNGTYMIVVVRPEVIEAQEEEQESDEFGEE